MFVSVTFTKSLFLCEKGPDAIILFFIRFKLKFYETRHMKDYCEQRQRPVFYFSCKTGHVICSQVTHGARDTCALDLWAADAVSRRDLLE